MIGSLIVLRIRYAIKKQGMSRIYFRRRDWDLRIVLEELVPLIERWVYLMSLSLRELITTIFTVKVWIGLIIERRWETIKDKFNMIVRWKYALSTHRSNLPSIKTMLTYRITSNLDKEMLLNPTSNLMITENKWCSKKMPVPLWERKRDQVADLINFNLFLATSQVLTLLLKCNLLNHQR
jgi:hypothetical protein